MTEFAHISPTSYLDRFASNRRFHLTLAHLVEQDSVYADWYANMNREENTINILDNSAFEMYKQGREMYPAHKLVDMGKRINADYIVMSDYPAMECGYTIEAAEKLAPEFKSNGFGTFFVPQSKVGDLEDLINGFEWAADSELVDYIGVSILAVPNAYGVEKNNKLQRYLSRWSLMVELEKRGILDKIVANNKRLHFLGMVDGPNEIRLMGEMGFLPLIDTWDSSAAVWAGICNIMFDSSPTGLTAGKNEIEVDFDHNTATVDQLEVAAYNVDFIDKMLGEYTIV